MILCPVSQLSDEYNQCIVCQSIISMTMIKGWHKLIAWLIVLQDKVAKSIKTPVWRRFGYGRV
jgi:hypothetical protein